MPVIPKIFQNNAFPRLFSQTSLDKEGQFFQSDTFPLENPQLSLPKAPLFRPTSLTWRIDGPPSQDVFGSMQFIDILRDLVTQTELLNDGATLLILINEPSSKDYIESLFPNATSVIAITMDEFKYQCATSPQNSQSDESASKFCSQIPQERMDIESEMILAEKTCRSCNSANENKNLFCWNCGLFLPASLAKAKRESIYRESATCDPLAMYQKMKDKQTVNRSYNPIKSYVSFRSILIDKIAKLVKGLNHQLIDSDGLTNKQMLAVSKLSKKEELHLAVAYLDTFYALNEPVSFPEMEIVAIVCMILAIKFCNDLSRDLKDYYEALKVYQYNVSMQDFLRVESTVAQTLEWEFWIRTPFEFLHFFLSRGVIFDTDKFGSLKLDEELLQSLRLVCEEALEQGLHDFSNNQYTSHMVGAAALACGRRGLGIEPVWNGELEELTGISWSELEGLYRAMYENLESKKPEVIGYYKKTIAK